MNIQSIRELTPYFGEKIWKWLYCNLACRLFSFMLLLFIKKTKQHTVLQPVVHLQKLHWKNLLSITACGIVPSGDAEYLVTKIWVERLVWTKEHLSLLQQSQLSIRATVFYRVKRAGTICFTVLFNVSVSHKIFCLFECHIEIYFIILLKLRIFKLLWACSAFLYWT